MSETTIMTTSLSGTGALVVLLLFVRTAMAYPEQIKTFVETWVPHTQTVLGVSLVSISVLQILLITTIFAYRMLTIVNGYETSASQDGVIAGYLICGVMVAFGTLGAGCGVLWGK